MKMGLNLLVFQLAPKTAMNSLTLMAMFTIYQFGKTTKQTASILKTKI